ncbi:hypothetical protein [Deinococcus cellulosilyticus]|uniref:Uncharacterized protein n=1 Tax=Deinococcus cellulosilyticus (strain DSM 18568 / NBRC 106333 / KACC 11606 / 5516J-15) TaxID=1223518 RepID=A0A511N0G6_DEIC1|nr:hypothetical protein [Deinococcus cellulosilyticus]GEM45876.1 hypothetical protein DC3_15110 [Deinococcus cellulosilyticus NBRC 106333 = KACC 11606]
MEPIVVLTPGQVAARCEQINEKLIRDCKIFADENNEVDLYDEEGTHLLFITHDFLEDVESGIWAINAMIRAFFKGFEHGKDLGEHQGRTAVQESIKRALGLN